MTLYAVLPAYAFSLAYDLATIGVLLSANRLVRLGSNPVVGLLLSGARRRGFVLAGLGLGALSTLLYLLPGSGLFLAGLVVNPLLGGFLSDQVGFAGALLALRSGLSAERWRLMGFSSSQ